MRIKAIRDLMQLSDLDYLDQISSGYEQVFKNAEQLNLSAELLLEENQNAGARILFVFAEEEAAKCLILLDAVRCPRQPEKVLSKHLYRFYDHLAKAIYAEACYASPSDFSEFLEYIDHVRQEFYLDGPNDFDWIYYNRLLSQREESIYVDYVEHESGKHFWIKPNERGNLTPETSMSLALARVFQQTGCTTPQSLKVIADIWRPIIPSPTLRWEEFREINHQTIYKLFNEGLARFNSEKEQMMITDVWPFPMHSIDLGMSQGNKDELRKRRNQWLEWLEQD